MAYCERSDLTWNNLNLMFRNKKVAWIVPDTKEPAMHWIHWLDKSRSGDFYNMTRAKEHAANVTMRELNRLEAMQETSGGP
jgi:hypothetical protein